MNLPLRTRIAVIFAFLTTNLAATIFAKESPISVIDNQPFVTVFVSSLSRFRAACEVIYESVDRRDLFDSMDSRLTRYNEFRGIDPDKPLGIMFAWGKTSTPYIVFLPTTEIDDLLHTATFGVVGFHQVSASHYEIERRQKPYQVLIRQEYALITESVSTVHDLRTTPNQITRNLREKYDFAVHFDFRHVPQADKHQRIKALRAVVEPLLQCGDDEPPQSGRVRKGIGVMLLDAIERVCIDTKTLTIGMRVSPDGHLEFIVEFEALPKSLLAKGCNQCAPRKNSFSGMLDSDSAAPAVAVIKLMGLQRLVEETLYPADKSTMRNSQTDLVMQLVGDREGEFSLVTALRGADVNTINRSLTELLKFSAVSEVVGRPDEESEPGNQVNIHQLNYPTLPQLVTRWTGPNPVMLLSSADQALWFGIGSPDDIFGDLTDAIEFADESMGEATVLPIAQARIQGRVVSEFIASNSLIPNMNATRVREELSRGEDEVTVKVEPIADGMRLRVDFEAGFVRLMGRDWTRQVEAGAYLR